MNSNRDWLAPTLLRIATVYFVLGVSLGVVMGISQNFVQHPTHAHLNLLGWASLALISLVYRSWPAIAEGPLPVAHFWLHNLGLPVAMVALFMELRGHLAMAPVLGISSMVIGIGILCFAVNVWMKVGRS